MNNTVRRELPELFRRLADRGCLNEGDFCHTADGFCAVKKPLSDILAHCGITTVPGEQGNELECGLFFDDWYLYAVSGGTGNVYSLFKMREQEHDAELGLYADGDAPGVTISFIALQEQLLLDGLSDTTAQSRKRLGDEIDRVVARAGQTHSRALKEYFIRTEAQGPYLIAALYTDFIAALARDGFVPVPDRYASDYKKTGIRGRVPGFLEENNRAAGTLVCDHETIRVRDPQCPTEYERLAILATHTGNVSVYSFAAEVQFHARFLTWWAKIPLPVIGRSVYASAIRADMSIADAEFTGPTPYYRLNSRGVRKQQDWHQGKL